MQKNCNIIFVFGIKSILASNSAANEHATFNGTRTQKYFLITTLQRYKDVSAEHDIHAYKETI